jgi:ABC-type uncharacterized transport system permease subunit
LCCFCVGLHSFWHARSMQLKLAIWAIVAAAVAGTLLTAAPAALRTAHLHLPA